MFFAKYVHFRISIITFVATAIGYNLLAISTQNVTMTEPKFPINNRSGVKQAFLGIVGGSDAEEGKWPYIVSLQLSDGESYNHNCGGTILNDDTILTAAHCVFNIPPELMQVYIGNSNIEQVDETFLYEVSTITIHSEYDSSKIDAGNDIALVKLSKKIDFKKFPPERVQKVCVGEIEPVTEKCMAIGWGQIAEDGNPVNKALQQVSLPILSQEDCTAALNVRNDLLLCAYDNKQVGICYGDSGGPLLCPGKDAESEQYIQFGISSFVIPPCASSPSFFTNVSAFVQWIREHAEN